MTERRRYRRGGERGQAAVELALALPVVALLVLFVVQIGLVVRDDLLVVHAAREAARAAAVEPAPAAARAAARRAGGLDARGLSVRLALPGGQPPLARVTVTYRSATRVPIVGPLLPAVTLHATVTMAVEEVPGGGSMKDSPGRGAN